jgi:hypothetical protein
MRRAVPRGNVLERRFEQRITMIEIQRPHQRHDALEQSDERLRSDECHRFLQRPIAIVSAPTIDQSRIGTLMKLERERVCVCVRVCVYVWLLKPASNRDEVKRLVVDGRIQSHTCTPVGVVQNQPPSMFLCCQCMPSVAIAIGHSHTMIRYLVFCGFGT